MKEVMMKVVGMKKGGTVEVELGEVRYKLAST